LIIKYIGKCKVEEIFSCELCSQISKVKFEATPSLPALVDWEKLDVCKKCAQRELGSKKKNKLKAMMETTNGKNE